MIEFLNELLNYDPEAPAKDKLAVIEKYLKKLLDYVANLLGI